MQNELPFAICFNFYLNPFDNFVVVLKQEVPLILLFRLFRR